MNPLINSIGVKNLGQIDVKNIQTIISLIKTKNPSECLTTLLNGNPQFKEFYDANKNKNPEDVAKEYGIDYSLIKQFLK